ncbi:MAG: NAD(P)H-dependent glycerol-3-phosphate dehydrogenase [Candidatus Omnitrophota bacterium]
MSKELKKVSVIGDGGWGTTLAILLSRKGIDVTLWSAFPAYARMLSKKRTNPNFLKGIRIPKDIKITASLREALSADLLVLAVPSQYLRSVLSKARLLYDRAVPVVSVVKGIEDKTLLRMSEVIRDVWRPKHAAVLSGPTIAMEVVCGIPTTAVVAAHDQSLMLSLQDLFMSPTFRIYTNKDTIGVELGGSLKNIIAIACGISDGLGFGTNTKAAILSRGSAEMARLGMKMGAKRETFFGLSGLGDLVTTCFNPLSRNHSVGEKIGRGVSWERIRRSMKMVAEGVPTAKAAHGLGKKYKVDLPITNEIYQVLFKNRSPREAVKSLMARGKKAE